MWYYSVANRMDGSLTEEGASANSVLQRSRGAEAVCLEGTFMTLHRTQSRVTPWRSGSKRQAQGQGRLTRDSTRNSRGTSRVPPDGVMQVHVHVKTQC